MAERLVVESTFTVYDDYDSLPVTFRELIDAAVLASDNAYAPYSNFHVGAAVLTEDNKITIGNNQENAAYPSGLCAERVALFHASATKPDELIKAIAVVAKKRNDSKPAMPCGSCRQVICEYETKQNVPIQIVMAYHDGKYIVATSGKDLLPFSFTKTDL